MQVMGKDEKRTLCNVFFHDGKVGVFFLTFFVGVLLFFGVLF